VLVNSRRDGHVGSVILDDSASTRVAVDYLAGLGHTRIGLINGFPTTDTAQRRGDGFRDAMLKAGLDVRAEYETSLGYEPKQGREALRQLLTLDEPPTAVVVANVNAALGALLEARILGLRVPEQLSLVAVHDAWPAENTWPPLTTVRMPLYELGRASMRAMVDRISSEKMGDQVVTDPAPELIVRESAAPPTV
jgi:LacI family transcriptional regulator